MCVLWERSSRGTIEKATFEACLGLYGQNMKTWGRNSRRGGMWKPRRRVRRIEHPSNLKSYTRDSTLLQKQHATAETMHERGPPRPKSACPACAGRESGPDAGRKQVFSGSDGGLSRGVWTGPFAGFSTSSTLTLWIHSEHSKPQPA